MCKRESLPPLIKKKQINIYIKQSSGVEEKKELFVAVFELICCVIVFFLILCFNFILFHCTTFIFISHLHYFKSPIASNSLFGSSRSKSIMNEGSKNFFLLTRKQKIVFIFNLFLFFFLIFSSFSICKQKCRNKYNIFLFFF